MKILSVAWNVFDEGVYPRISRNGGSVAIYNICEYIGRQEESLLLIGNKLTDGYVYGNIRILNNSKYLPLTRSVENIDVWQEGLKRIFDEILIEEKPDFVFVHGAGEFAENCIITCVKRNQKYAFVNHSYFGNGAKKYGGDKAVEWERRVFNIPDVRMLMVGNCMRKKMLSDYPDFPSQNVQTIVNGTHYVNDIVKSNLRERLDIGNKKVLVCVGRIYKRKNQIQLTRIFKYLPREVNNDLVILICGKDSVSDPGWKEVKDAIYEERVQDKIIYIGDFEEEGMKSVYSIADGLIMPSYSEGLSLVVLEMLVYGKPVIMFSDNETACDVNDTEAVVLAGERTDKSLADAVAKWYYQKWNYEYIKSYAKRFNMDRVAREYIDYAKNRVQE